MMASHSAVQFHFRHLCSTCYSETGQKVQCKSVPISVSFVVGIPRVGGIAKKSACKAQSKIGQSALLTRLGFHPPWFFLVSSRHSLSP
jgi:hypothetical protein